MYNVWGNDLIDQQSHEQITAACALPIARDAALMPDAHCGYGLPVGGVFAAKNAVIPYGVGVDIACRMRLTVFDESPNAVHADILEESLKRGTFFGIGVENEQGLQHDVMDDAAWQTTDLLRRLKDKAYLQLGTSGSGNHFVEFGTFTSLEGMPGVGFGSRLALLSHSGSRGAGAQVCKRYTDLAKCQNNAGELSWLDLDTEAGQEYWEAMELMGRYAAANHETIHNLVTVLTGLTPVTVIENHHNFAWKEVYHGEEVIVHRKGATPAGEGVLGVIPGSMSSPGFVVRGKGNPYSLNSASHGAGRTMSRKQAKKTFDRYTCMIDLDKKGIRLIGGDLDEMQPAYKDIHAVMAAQTDLVDVIGEFHPKVVRMCGDGSRAED